MYTYSGNALGSRMAFDAVQSDLESSAYRSAAEWLTCAQACTMRSFQLLWIGIGSIMSDKQGLSSIRGGPYCPSSNMQCRNKCCLLTPKNLMLHSFPLALVAPRLLAYKCRYLSNKYSLHKRSPQNYFFSVYSTRGGGGPIMISWQRDQAARQRPVIFVALSISCQTTRYRLFEESRHSIYSNQES